MRHDIDSRLASAKRAVQQLKIIDALTRSYGFKIPVRVETLEDLCLSLEELLAVHTSAPEDAVLFVRSPEWPYEPVYWSSNFEEVTGFDRRYLSGEHWLTLTHAEDKKPLVDWIDAQDGYPFTHRARHPNTGEPLKVMSVLRHVRESGADSRVVALVGWFRILKCPE